MVNIEMSDAEYQDWLHSQGQKSVTQEEVQAKTDEKSQEESFSRFIATYIGE